MENIDIFLHIKQQYKMRLKYTLLLFALIATTVYATNPPEEAFKADLIESKDKNLRFSIMGGPGYTPDYGFLIGGSTLFTFSTEPDNKSLQRSVVPISFGLTFAKPIGINVMVKPQLFLNDDKIRVMGTYVFKNINENFYGMGYNTQKNTKRETSVTQYYNSSIVINPIVQFRLGKSSVFLGPNIDFSYDRIENPGSLLLSDKNYIAQGGDSTGVKIRSMGLGPILSYDTRDVAANAYRGVYFELKALYYAKWIGSDNNYGSVSIDYRQYLQLPRLGERRVLAWTIASKNSFGDIPFNKYPLVGSPFDLRGYYVGQYRSRSTAYAIAEYRHMFNFGDETKTRRFFSRFGFAAWAGSGFMGQNPVKYEAALPNFGAGLRIELQPRMNFRLDVGRSPIDKQTLFYFNMTEAF